MKEIIETYKYNVQTIIKKFTGQYDEDIEQEIYIKTWKNLDKYQEVDKFKQWISTIAANVCRDYLKSAQNRNSKLHADIENNFDTIKDKNQTPEAVLDAKMRQKVILKAIDKLPKKLKEVIILFELEEMTYEQISKKTNTPIGTIKSRLFNARSALSQVLENLL